MQQSVSFQLRERKQDLLSSAIHQLRLERNEGRMMAQARENFLLSRLQLPLGQTKRDLVN